jgi:hypothetical protein
MKITLCLTETSSIDFNKRFLEFFRLLANGKIDRGLFPRDCRLCGETFQDVAEYCCLTKPKAHCFEDCRSLSDSNPFMLFYRHCKCGNTLAVTISEDMFPDLHLFWQMLHDESEGSGRMLKDVIIEFVGQFDQYLKSLNTTDNVNRK